MALKDDIVRLQRQVEELQREVQAMKLREIAKFPLSLETKNV